MSQEKAQVIVFVKGGVVQDIDTPAFVQATTIDWDDFEDDPINYFQEFDSLVLKHIENTLPLVYADIRGVYDDAILDAAK